MSPVAKITSKLVILAVAMFGFGYVLVPIYSVFCDITGLNGKTGTITEAEASKKPIDLNREVTVQFDTNVHGELPWAFKAEQFKISVHPGKPTDVYFEVENKSDREIVGQAIPSLAPGEAAVYFNKTECFCFSQQTLEPKERKRMLVRFVVDPDLPKKITSVTLSYTFFMAPGENKTTDVAEEDPENNLNKQKI